MPITSHTPTPRQDNENCLIRELAAALEGLIKYAAWEAIGMESETRDQHAQAEAKRARKSIKAARALIARARAA
jgi:hypothetical protein